MRIEESISVIKSLADTSRMLILGSLAEKEQYVEELAERHNLAVSTVSFHLKKLEKAGLVTPRKEQYYIIYSCNHKLLDITLKELLSFKDAGRYIQEKRIKDYKLKVLKVFFKNGRLIKLPAQHKKKLIVLEELLKLFDNNRDYSEREVDDIIHKKYDDHCTIRRLFIEEKMMKRSKQMYVRII